MWRPYFSEHFLALILLNLKWSSAPSNPLNHLLFQALFSGFREEIKVFAEMWILLNFGNRFKPLRYLLGNFVALFLSIFFDSLGFNNSAISFLTNLDLLHRHITSSWLFIAFHDACFAILFRFDVLLTHNPTARSIILLIQTLSLMHRKSFS